MAPRPVRQLLPLAILAVIAAYVAVQTGKVTAPKRPLAQPERAQAEVPVADQAPSGPKLPAPEPLSVADSLSAMQVVPGFKVDCIASEPAVEAPVWMSFDEDGRLWVVEMRSYMPDIEGTNEKLPTNRISVLEDRDGDGSFETSRVFMEDLVLPRGVMPCYGGVLVIEPPNLIFCKDTDGDGRADVKTKLLDGFAGIENPEHAGNGPIYGIDNWCHFSQHGVEVRFDGKKIEKRSVSGHGQWGITQDDRGRLYYTPNSNPLLLDVFPKRFGAGNSNMSSVAGMGENIAQDAVVTWPIHPTPGVNRGYQDKVLREDQTLANLTAACGPSIYRAGLLGEEFRGDAFICEPAAQIIKRIKLAEGAGLPKGRNAYEQREFVASTDERFRPVNSCIGPDGALYVCDMYRGVIQHKTYLTEYLKAQIRDRKLETPLNMGRIYRIAPVDFTPRMMPKLSVLSDEMLVELLSHKDGWYRDTAQRLLVERRAVAVESRLRELFAGSGEWRVRLHALRTLEGLGIVNEADIRKGVEDSAAGVRAAAIEMFAARGEAEEVGEAGGAVDLAQLFGAEKDVTTRATIAGAMSVVERRRTRAAVDQAAIEERARALSNMPDAYSRDAMLAGMKGLEPAALKSLLANGAGSDGEPWPRSDETSRKLFSILTTCLMRAGDSGRLALVELAAELAAGHPRAEMLYKRIASEQRLEAEEPKVMKLSQEPKQWLAVAGDSGNKLSADFKASVVYFDWPNRPRVNRPKKMKALTAGEQELFSQGEILYGKCSGCHQPEGEGSPGQAPSLVSSKILTGPASNAIKVILQGLDGEYTLGESKYSGSMPPPPVETDKEIAAVLTYARRSFGNVASPVKVEEVSRVRAATRGRTKAWTREELK